MREAVPAGNILGGAAGTQAALRHPEDPRGDHQHLCQGIISIRARLIVTVLFTVHRQGHDQLSQRSALRLAGRPTRDGGQDHDAAGHLAWLHLGAQMLGQSRLAHRPSVTQHHGRHAHLAKHLVRHG